MKEMNIKPVEAKRITNLTITTKLLMLLKSEAPTLKKNTTQVLEIAKGKSCVKDAMDYYGCTAASDLDIIERIVNLSEELHDLNLEQYVSGIARPAKPETYNLEEVDATLARFKKLLATKEAKGNILSYELRELTDVALVLEGYERAVNGTLNNGLYKILASYGTLALKAKLLDACKFPVREIEGVKIMKGEFAFEDERTGKVYTVPVEKAGGLGVTGYAHKLMSAINGWNKLSSKANNTGDTYDGRRNDDLLNGCDMLKAFTLMDFYLDKNGKFAPASSMFSVSSTVRKYDRDLARAEKEKAKVKTLEAPKTEKTGKKK